MSSTFGVPTRSQQLIAQNKAGGSVLTPAFMQEFLTLTEAGAARNCATLGRASSATSRAGGVESPWLA